MVQFRALLNILWAFGWILAVFGRYDQHQHVSRDSEGDFPHTCFESQSFKRKILYQNFLLNIKAIINLGLQLNN